MSSAVLARRAGRASRGARSALPVLAVALALLGVEASAASAGAGKRRSPAPGSGRIQVLDHPGVRSFYAFVDVAAIVHAQPAAASRQIARLPTRTPDGTSQPVAILARSENARGREWLKVALPGLPNGRTGWVRRIDVGEIHTTSSWLGIDTRRLRAVLVRHGRKVFSAPVGIGRPAAPTPHGHFYVIDRLHGFPPGSLYGPLAFGTSARSAVLTDWPGGGVVGIHGTNQPRLVPGHPSHGCIRMHNRDIVRLGHLIGVGTPVWIF